MTFLVMGIDKNRDVKEVAEGTNGGQADALFLVVLNPHDDSLSVIGINRNAMTEISVYDDNGAFVNTIKAQIAVQHGFGNGVEESCEYQVNAVQHLFYEMPIHGYAAINMSAIGPLTDMVGGVDVVALEDVKSGNNTVIKEGEEVYLEGDLAFAYIHNRVNYRDLTRKSKIDDMKFYDDLLFDFLTMFLFRTNLEEELDLQIEFNEDDHDYVKMTVTEFVDTVYELIKDSNINV